MYPFVTFESHDRITTYTKCLKYLTLQISSRQKSDTSYYIDFDNKSIKVSKETYNDVENLMVECNKKFDRANLNNFSPSTGASF